MNGVAAIRATPNLIFTVGAFLYFYRGAADLLAGVAGFFISILANECRRSFSFLFAGAAEQPAPVLLVGTTPLTLSSLRRHRQQHGDGRPSALPLHG